jgi:hypothetical protein
MAYTHHGNRMADDLSKLSWTEIVGYTIAAVGFAVGIVGSLGEWVFHWWHEPFEVVGPLGLLLGAFGVVWSASGRDLRLFRREMASVSARQTVMLEELLRGQQELLRGQQEILRGQAEQTAMLREQTALLREVVASFRARPGERMGA